MYRICVFCGSNHGSRPAYAEAAQRLGREIAGKHIGLVYGGAKVGIMGTIADAVLGEGGQVIGVMPKFLVQKEVAHQGLSELRIVDSMHERKRLMADLADGFIALPGGLGTLEEFFEMVTWAQLRMHSKPCGLLNTCGYYNGLMQFLDHAVSEMFIRVEHRSMIFIHERPTALLEKFASYEPPQVGKWMSRSN